MTLAGVKTRNRFASRLNVITTRTNRAVADIVDRTIPDLHRIHQRGTQRNGFSLIATLGRTAWVSLTSLLWGLACQLLVTTQGEGRQPRSLQHHGHRVRDKRNKAKQGHTREDDVVVSQPWVILRCITGLYCAGKPIPVCEHESQRFE